MLILYVIQEGCNDRGVACRCAYSISWPRSGHIDILTIQLSLQDFL